MNATILCYHKVGPEVEEGRRLNIEPRRLETHVEYFVRRGNPVVRACDLVDPWHPGTVCFTFDDAYASTMAHAPEIFERHGVRASFYAVPGRVGKTSDWDGDLARPLADWDQLISAYHRGHEIGNHTQNHVHLGQISREEAASEILEARNELASRGISNKSFCYPYGSLSPESVRQVQQLGYPIGLALGKAIAQDTDDPIQLPRVVVAFSDALPMLLYKIVLKPKLKRRRK